ncbi:DUF4214 domain-containing protein [Undibacterium sp. Ji83W]|uniref:DUF4214 domain-containing protein n=1 Tax=Undibacterium sp. Ji83W TaxID=3413043 RepID=UPI003BF2BB34
MATEVEIQNLYIAYFNRPADKAGLAYWKDANLSILQIAQSFSEQKEYATAFAGFTAEQTINALYNNLFNHKADADGLAYWSGQIKSGKVSIGAAAIAILNGATGADQIAVQSKNAAAIAFTQKLATDPVTAYAYSMGGTVFNLAKNWLAPVIDNASGVNAINSLGITAERMVFNAPFGSDKLAGITLVPVLAGQNNTGKIGDFNFTTDDSQLLAASTRLTGNGASVALNVNSFFSPVSHNATVISGVQTLNLQAGADTSNAGSDFLNSFKTINVNKLTGGDNIVLGGLSGQTVNLNNITGNSTVTLGGANQSVIQTSELARSLVKSTTANLTGANLNFSNASTGEHILEITDSGYTKLTTASMTGISGIILRDTTDNSIDISPSRAVSISLYGTKNNHVNAYNGQDVSITGVKASSLALGGNSKFTIENSQFSTINLYDKGGTLSIKDINTQEHSIYSAVATKLDLSGASGAVTLYGTGSYDITGVGNKASAFFFEMTTDGNINLTTAGSNSVGYYEFMGTGAVTVNIGGTGLVDLGSSRSHSSTTVYVTKPDSTLWLSGSGGLIDVIEAEGKAGNFTVATATTAPSNIKLAKTGFGSDKIKINNSTIENIKTALATISNFNVTGSDKLATGIIASSLNKISVNSSDLSSLANNIDLSIAAAGIPLLGNSGQAFVVTVNNGEAAGTYFYQHKPGMASAVTGSDLIVKLIGAGLIELSTLIDF